MDLARADRVRESALYPESDGQPMGESEFHIEILADLLTILRHHFRDEADVHVAANLIVYYVEEVPGKCVVPDLFVVRGSDKRLRRTWKTWEEGLAPQFVLEILSESTYLEDQGNKRVLYRDLGVQEYAILDPHGGLMRPPLQAWRRSASGEWEALAEGNSFRSDFLGLEFRRREDGRLRVVDPATGEVLRNLEEERAAREEERKAREEAEAEVARLRAEIERLKRP